MDPQDRTNWPSRPTPINPTFQNQMMQSTQPSGNFSYPLGPQCVGFSQQQQLAVPAYGAQTSLQPGTSPLAISPEQYSQFQAFLRLQRQRENGELLPTQNAAHPVAAAEYGDLSDEEALPLSQAGQKKRRATTKTPAKTSKEPEQANATADHKWTTEDFKLLVKAKDIVWLRCKKSGREGEHEKQNTRWARVAEECRANDDLWPFGHEDCRKKYTWLKTQYQQLKKCVNSSSGADWWSMSRDEKMARWGPAGSKIITTSTLLKNDRSLYDVMHESLGSKPAQTPPYLLQSGVGGSFTTVTGPDADDEEEEQEERARAEQEKVDDLPEEVHRAAHGDDSEQEEEEEGELRDPKYDTGKRARRPAEKDAPASRRRPKGKLAELEKFTSQQAVTLGQILREVTEKQTEALVEVRRQEAAALAEHTQTMSKSMENSASILAGAIAPLMNMARNAQN